MIVYMVTKNDPNRRVAVLIMGACGAGLLASVGAYYALPSRSTVPVLDNLSQTDAEDLLKKNRLVPSAHPQYAQNVEAGRVVPHSQSPAAGLTVTNDSVVAFGVCQQSTVAALDPPEGRPPRDSAPRFFEPRTQGQLHCRLDAQRITRWSVSGTTGDIADARLLLWLQPVNPPSETPGWYLQRQPANGIKRIESDGTWTGSVQIGDARYPAHEGDHVEIAVSALNRDAADRLLGEAGVVVRDRPEGERVDVASKVVVTFR
jgi:hypothetical protein